VENFTGFMAFVRSAESGSFVEAAKVMGISASAVGKSVQRLEDRLGTRLFQRNTRNMYLTAEGELFLQRCRAIMLQMNAAEEELADINRHPRGKLRVSLPSIGTFFYPVLERFSEKYPQVELDIDFSDRKVELIEEGFDAAVRIGSVEDSTLVSRKVFSFQRVVVASPQYLNKMGKPKDLKDLSGHVLLLYKFPNTGKLESWPIEGWNDALVDEWRLTIRCNSIEMISYFAAHGRGIACLPDFVASAGLAGGNIVHVIDVPPMRDRDLTVLWPSNKYVVPKLRVFIDFIGDYF
jgi:DNA-binding transcriptional LysR family regulator